MQSFNEVGSVYKWCETMFNPLKSRTIHFIYLMTPSGLLRKRPFDKPPIKSDHSKFKWVWFPMSSREVTWRNGSVFLSLKFGETRHKWSNGLMSNKHVGKLTLVILFTGNFQHVDITCAVMRYLFMVYHEVSFTYKTFA